MNNKALSPLVGLALIFASVISVIAIYQVQTVPSILKEQEWEHYLLVKEKFESLAERSELASKSGGLVFVNFPLQLKYEGVSFAPLPPAPGCVIEAEKIGVMNVTYRGEELLSLDLVALKLVPKYNYLKADEEIFVLGKYFTPSGKLLKAPSKSELILLDANFDKISGSERVSFKVLPIINTSTGKVTVRVESKEEWLLDYLREEFNAIDVGSNAVEFNSTSIELVVASTSENVKNKLKEGQLSVNDMVFNVSLLSGGATLGEDEVEEEHENENAYIKNGGEVTVTFNDDSSVNSVTLYITGYTSYFNKKVNVSIVYEAKQKEERHDRRKGCMHEEEDEEERLQYGLNFTWSTLSNGYLQLPIEVPRKLGDEEEYKIRVILTFEKGKKFEFTIKVKEKEE